MIKIDKIDDLNDRNVMIINLRLSLYTPEIILQFVGIQFSIIMDAIGLLLAI